MNCLLSGFVADIIHKMLQMMSETSFPNRDGGCNGCRMLMPIDASTISYAHMMRVLGLPDGVKLPSMVLAFGRALRTHKQVRHAYYRPS